MARTTAIIEREMRKEGYVSAAITSAQYGITRSQLIDLVLQGKLKSKKPDNGAAFYVFWKDCIATLGTPAEYRANPRKALEPDIEIDDEPEILLDGMLAAGDLDEIYRKQAAQRSENKQRAAELNQAAKQINRIVTRPAPQDDFDNPEL